MSNGQEFYPSQPEKKQKYTKNSKKEETYLTHYEKDKDNNEIYQTQNGVQLYASDENVNPYYAKLANQSEYYAHDAENNERYIKVDKVEVYARNELNEEIYAQKNGSQFYAKNRRGRPRFAKIGTRQVYAKDASLNDIYPRGADGKCIVAKDNDIPYYATANGESIYPTDENGDEFVVNDVLITSSEGKIVLPTNKLGFPKYELDEDGNEKYLYDNMGRPIFGMTKWGEEMYVKSKDLNEVYPIIHGEPVFAKRGSMNKYALDKDGFVQYPERNGEPFYIEGSNEMLRNHFKIYIEGQYPKDSHGKEILMDETYNIDDDGEFFYPKDEFLNEYTCLGGYKFINNEYPVTNDGYVIVPNEENEPHILSHLAVTNDNITSLLFRSNRSYDFLTNVKTKSKKASIPYKILPLSKFNCTPFYLNRTVQYIVGALVFIIFVLILALNVK